MWREWLGGAFVVAATVIGVWACSAIVVRVNKWLDDREARMQAEAVDRQQRELEAMIDRYRRAAVAAYENN